MSNLELDIFYLKQIHLNGYQKLNVDLELQLHKDFAHLLNFLLYLRFPEYFFQSKTLKFVKGYYLYNFIFFPKFYDYLKFMNLHPKFGIISFCLCSNFYLLYSNSIRNNLTKIYYIL